MKYSFNWQKYLMLICISDVDIGSPWQKSRWFRKSTTSIWEWVCQIIVEFKTNKIMEIFFCLSYQQSMENIGMWRNQSKMHGCYRGGKSKNRSQCKHVHLFPESIYNWMIHFLNYKIIFFRLLKRKKRWKKKVNYQMMQFWRKKHQRVTNMLYM